MQIDGSDITFRPHRLGFFLSLAVILGVGLACLTLGFGQHPAWFAGAALIAYLGAALVSRYTAGSLALRGFDLALYLGTFVTREVTCPLWQARITICQSLIGRALDAGTVIVQVGEERVQCRVAQLRAFRRLDAERKLQLLALAERHTRSSALLRILARDLVEAPRLRRLHRAITCGALMTRRPGAGEMSWAAYSSEAGQRSTRTSHEPSERRQQRGRESNAQSIVASSATRCRRSLLAHRHSCHW